MDTSSHLREFNIPATAWLRDKRSAAARRRQQRAGSRLLAAATSAVHAEIERLEDRRLFSSTLFWDPGHTPTANSGHGSGGSGAWNTTAANWSNGTTDVVWNNANNDIASFAAGSGGTATLGAAVSASAVTFNATGYTVAASGTNALSLTNATSDPLTVAGGASATVSARVVGSGGLSITGGGTLILSGTDTFTGLQVNAGTLDVTGTLTTTGSGTGNGNYDYIANGGTNGGTANDSGTLIIDTNATFNVTGSYGDNFVIGRDSGSGTITQNAGSTFNFNPSSNKVLLIDASTSSATNAIYNLNGGTLNVNSGKIDVGYGAGAGHGTLNVASGATLSNLGTFLVGVGSAIGTVNQNGGSIAVSNANPVVIANGAGNNGTYNLNGGTLITPGVQTLGGTSTFNFNGGTLKANAASATFLAGLPTASVLATAGSTIDNGGFNITIGQPLLHGGSSADGGLSFGGAGTTALAASNSYSGGTTVTAGTLQLVSPATPGSAGSAVTINGGALDLNGTTQTVGKLSGAGGSILNSSAGNVIFTVGSGDAAGTFAGNLTTSTGSVALQKIGSGTITLSAAANSVTGLQVNGGTLDVTGTFSTTGSGAGNGNYDYIANGGTNGGTANDSGTLIIDTNATFNVTGSYGDNFVIGRDSGSGTITENAGSTFNFNPSSNKVLLIDASTSSSTNAVYNLNGGTLNMNGGKIDVGYGSGAGHGTLNMSGGSINNVGTFCVANGGAAIGIVNQSAGSINISSANPAVIATGAGTTGTYNLNGGTLTASGVTTTGGTSALNFNGGTLKANAASATFLTGLTSTSVLAGSGSTIDNGGFAITIGQPLLHGGSSADGGLRFGGAGTTTLSASNSYSGATTVSAGTLKVDGALSASPVSVASGATLAGTGAIGGATSIAGGGTLSPGDGAPGVVSTGNFSLATGSNFNDTINGNSSGTFGQANVTGTVTLNNAYLNLSGSRTNHDGDVITLVSNDAADAVSGTFNNLPQGSKVVVNGVNYVISYVGGTGNDVTLTDATPPHAASDNYNASQNITLTQNAAHGVLSNDAGYNGGTLAVYSVDGGTGNVSHTLNTGHGNLTLNSDGGFTYVPQHDFVGTDNATFYVASDGVELSNQSTLQFVVAPGVLTATGTTITGSEGTSTGSVTVAHFTDSAGGTLAEYSASINWNDGHTTGGTVSSDGAGGWNVQASHTYDDNASYSVGVSITSNVGGSASASSTATISNVAPTASITGAPTSNVAAGTPINLTASVTDPSGADTAAGFTDAWAVTKNGASFSSGTGSSFSFTPDDNGTYAVSLIATDKNGGASSAATGSVTANPSIIAVSVGSISATTGQSFSGAVATFTDTNPHTTAGQYSATITWGDGSTSSGTIASGSAGGFIVSGSHTYSAASPSGGDALSVSVTRDAQHSGNSSGTATVASAATAPTVATAATGVLSDDKTYVTLSVLGADALGESGLTYTWTATGPSGAPTPIFTDSGTNGAKQTLAFFQQAGTYTFQARITNTAGLSTTSSMNVTVDQIGSGIQVNPPSPVIAAGTTQTFGAVAVDQFGGAMTSQPTFTWSLESGGEGGTINSSGVYAAGTTAGTDAIDVAAGSLSGQAFVSDVTAAPATPTGLTATAVEAAVVLTWDGAIDAATYNVYRGTSASAESGTPIASGLTDPTYTDTGLTDGGTYFYTIKAINPLGTSAASAEASATPARVAPANLTATPGDHAIDISWSSAMGATSYNLYRSTSANGEGSAPYQTGLTEAGYSDPQTTGTTYYYKVTAVYSAGEGVASGESNAAAELAAPSAASSVIASVNGSNEVDLHWTAGSGADNYIIEMSTDGTTFTPYDQVDGSTLSYQESGAADGTAYTYEVLASNAVGASAPAQSAVVTTSLAAPDTLTADPVSGTKIELSWNNNSSATGDVQITRFTGSSTMPDFTVTLTPTLSVAPITYTDNAAGPGTTYHYRVAAELGSIFSATALVDATTVPTYLASLTASAPSSSQVNLSWTPVTGATGYVVDRKLHSASDSSWNDIDVVSATGGPTITYSDTGLSDGTVYDYKVIPYNDSGEADGTNPTASATTPLIAPANVTAIALSSSSVEVVWENKSSSETTFNVQRLLDGSPDGEPVAVDAGTTEYVDSGLQPDTAYTYAVSASNAAGVSAATASAEVTTPDAPPSSLTPAVVALSANAVSSSQIDLTWTPPTDGTHLELEEQAPGDDNFAVVTIPTPTTNSAGQLVYPMTGLTADASYSFRLRSDLNGLESYSGTARATTQPAPGAPGSPGSPSILTPTNTQLSIVSGGLDTWSFNGPYGQASDPTQWDWDYLPFLTMVSQDPFHVQFQSGHSDDRPTFNSETGQWTDQFDNAQLVLPSPYDYLATTVVTGEQYLASTPIPVSNNAPVQLDAPTLTSTPLSNGRVQIGWSWPEGTQAAESTYLTFYEVNGGSPELINNYTDAAAGSGSITINRGPAGSKVFAWGTLVTGSYENDVTSESKYSNFVNADGSAAVPAAPQNLSATPTSSGIRLLWDNAPDNETGFTIQRSTRSDFSAGLQTFSVNADVTSYLDAPGASAAAPQQGVTYYYRAKATNGAGGSDFSNTSNASFGVPTVSVTAIPITANAVGPDGQPQDGYFDFHRSGDLTSALTANVSSTGSTAIAGTDYSGTLPTQVSFVAGQQDVVVRTVPANGSPGTASMIQLAVTDPPAYTAITTPARVYDALHGVALKLGNGSFGSILQGSADGRSNLVPLTITIPPNQTTGSTITLSALEPQILDLWTTSTPGPTDRPLQWTGDSITWTIGQANVPTTLYVGATGGSRRVNDIVFSLYDTEPLSVAGSALSGGAGFALSNAVTAVRVSILSDLNGQTDGITDVTDLTRNWLVGQRVILGIKIHAPAQWVKNSTTQWNIPGDTLYRYKIAVDQQSASATKLEGTNFTSSSSKIGTDQSVVEWLWISNDQEDGPEKAHVTAHCTVNGQSYTASTDFYVYEPYSSLSATIGAAGLSPDKKRIGLFNLPGDPWIGIKFTGSVETQSEVDDAGGQWEFLQLQDMEYTVNGVSQSVDPTKFGLDNIVPIAGPFATESTVQGTNDSPNVGFSVSTNIASAKSKYITYIMYLPPGTSDWVPLKSVEWSIDVQGIVVDDTTGDPQAYRIQGKPSQMLYGIDCNPTPPAWAFVNKNRRPSH